MYILFISCLLSTDQCRSSYQVGFDNSLRITYANGMDTHYQTEPHILAGAANPTVARRNMSLPGESGQNLVEWRFRKEQARGKVIVFGRKLRVCLIPFFFFFSSLRHMQMISSPKVDLSCGLLYLSERQTVEVTLLGTVFNCRRLLVQKNKIKLSE